MNTVYFKPGADLSFKSVVAMRSKLYQALREDKSGKFGLDLSDVRHCDSAGLALLIEARKLCKKIIKPLKLLEFLLRHNPWQSFVG